MHNFRKSLHLTDKLGKFDPDSGRNGPAPVNDAMITFIVSIILLVAIFFSQIRENPIVDAAFKGMRPVVVALMFAPVLGLAKGLKWYAAAISAGVALGVWHFGFSPIYLLIIAALVGLLWAARRGKEVER